MSNALPEDKAVHTDRFFSFRIGKVCYDNFPLSGKFLGNELIA